MDYFKDLTYYNNLHYENARNVGFCPIGTAPVPHSYPEGFIPKLAKYLNYPVNVSRGIGFEKYFEIDGVKHALGLSEIRVLAQNGIVYAAPDAVVAYIAEGLYVPPAEFVDAVMNGVDPDSEAYQAYLARYTPEHCWGASNEYVADVVSVVGKIASGNLTDLKDLLARRKGLLDLVTGNGSLLHEAIIRNQEAIAQYLVEAGIHLDKFEGDELLVAVESGMKSAVVMLLNVGIPIKADRPRHNPLFLAIGRKQNEIAKYLYKTRTDLVVTYNTEFAENCNILQWTRMCNNDSFMEFLLNPF